VGASDSAEEQGMKLWQLGLLIFILSGALNAVFLNFSVGGLPRELARLSILTGAILLVVGLIKRKK
jgi:hypothetical protein